MQAWSSPVRLEVTVLACGFGAATLRQILPDPLSCQQPASLPPTDQWGMGPCQQVCREQSKAGYPWTLVTRTIGCRVSSPQCSLPLAPRAQCGPLSHHHASLPQWDFSGACEISWPPMLRLIGTFNGQLIAHILPL